MFIWVGYVFGILRKWLQIAEGGAFDWLFYLALAFYVLNITEITVDMLLYVRNRKLDAQEDNKVQKQNIQEPLSTHS